MSVLSETETVNLQIDSVQGSKTKFEFLNFVLKFEFRLKFLHFFT